MDFAASQFVYGQSVTTPAGTATVIGWDQSNTFVLCLMGDGEQIYFSIRQVS